LFANRAAIARVKRLLDPHKCQIFDFYVKKNCAPQKVAEKFGVPAAPGYLIKHRMVEALRIEVKRLEKEVT